MEKYKGKEVIDVTPKKEKNPKEIPLFMFFTVTVATNPRPQHLLVKAETALDALKYVQEVEKAPVIAVHVTEYAKYLDAVVSEDTDETVKSDGDVGGVEENVIQTP